MPLLGALAEAQACPWQAHTSTVLRTLTRTSRKAGAAASAAPGVGGGNAAEEPGHDAAAVVRATRSGSASALLDAVDARKRGARVRSGITD